MIYYRMTFQSVGSAEFDTAHFMHCDSMRSMGKYKKDVNPFLTHLSCVFLALTHRNENTFCTRTFMCSLWLLEQPVGQTLQWPVS